MILKGTKTRKDELKKKKKTTTELKEEWTRLDNTRKKIGKTDLFVLGHSDIGMPAIVSRSSLKGVKCRLVTYKDENTITTYRKASDIPDPTKAQTKVVREWTFDTDEETLPVYFEQAQNFTKDLWIEMNNPNNDDAVVSASIHGLIRSRRVR